MRVTVVARGITLVASGHEFLPFEGAGPSVAYTGQWPSAPVITRSRSAMTKATPSTVARAPVAPVKHVHPDTGAEYAEEDPRDALGGLI